MLLRDMNKRVGGGIGPDAAAPVTPLPAAPGCRPPHTTHHTSVLRTLEAHLMARPLGPHPPPAPPNPRYPPDTSHSLPPPPRLPVPRLPGPYNPVPPAGRAPTNGSITRYFMQVAFTMACHLM